MKPSCLHSFLSTHNIHAKKSLSQNFLTDKNIVAKLIADTQPDETIVEIGPGPGAITQQLLERGCRVIAIEKDERLASQLTRFSGKLTVIPGDFFDTDLTQFSPAKVISNIPFHLTAPILAKLLPMHETFSTLTLIMQKEVADRIVSPPGSKQFGSLSVLAQYYSSPKLLYSIRNTCFFPRPAITAAAISFSLKRPEKEINFPLVRQAFGQRRKMLTSSLKELLPKDVIQQVLAEQGLSISARPEALSVDNFVALSERYQNTNNK